MSAPNCMAIDSGLATWNYQTVIAGGGRIEVNYLMITEVGRRALDA